MQTCINLIDWWRTQVGPDDGDQGFDSSLNAIKLIIPANRQFVIDAGLGTPAIRLELKGPITIEGEDRFTSRIRLKESVPEQSNGDSFDQVGAAGSADGSSCLFLVRNKMDTTRYLGKRIAFRNFTMEGSYGTAADGDGYATNHGGAQLVKFEQVDELMFDQMVFRRSRAVVLGGDGVKKLTMRGCLMEESRRGGLVINDAENVVVEDNDFRWVSDDPVAITIGRGSNTDYYRFVGGPIRIVGNRVFGCRGLNVTGAKNVLIADNSSILCRGRAIHVGATTFEDKHDTSTLNVIIRDNIATDLLDAAVDPELDAMNGGHRAIDVELIYAANGALTSLPGLPESGGTIVDPAQYYYAADQGLMGVRLWRKAQTVDASPPPPADPTRTWWDGRIYTTVAGGTSGNAPPTGTGTNISDKGTDMTTAGVVWNYLKEANTTPPAGNLLVEGNIISRSRSAVSLFTQYGVGFWGGFDRTYPMGKTVGVTLDQITPDEGIAVSGWVRNMVIRGNQVRNCDAAISLQGAKQDTAFALMDLTIVDNDLSDWKRAGIRFFNYDTYPPSSIVPPQRISILNNRGDGDPFHWNRLGTVRLVNGKWANTTFDNLTAIPNVLAGTGAFIDATGVGIITIMGNHARNVAQLVAGLSDGLHAVQDNVGYCDPSAVGYSPSNIGIGNLIAPQRGWRYVIENGDPASADYGKLVSTCPLALNPTSGTGGASAAVPPAGGKWVAGTIVANLNPTSIVSGSTTYEIAGWRRLTTGTGNVLNTDWVQQRVLTG